MLSTLSSLAPIAWSRTSYRLVALWLAKPVTEVSSQDGRQSVNSTCRLDADRAVLSPRLKATARVYRATQ